MTPLGTSGRILSFHKLTAAFLVHSLRLQGQVGPQHEMPGEESQIANLQISMLRSSGLKAEEEMNSAIRSVCQVYSLRFVFRGKGGGGGGGHCPVARVVEYNIQSVVCLDSLLPWPQAAEEAWFRAGLWSCPPDHVDGAEETMRKEDPEMKGGSQSLTLFPHMVLNPCFEDSNFKVFSPN